MPRVQTKTGGREATHGVIPGRWAISVGKPSLPAPSGFRWAALTDLARLESGHTPSRRVPEYWGGNIPWIGIRDATEHHGLVLRDTAQHVTDQGIAYSSARVLPAGTVCLSRTASVGYVVMMGRPMATSQDFVNWVCGPDLEPHYLKYILLAEQESIRRFAHGTTHQTMYYPEAKALHVCVPDVEQQRRALAVLKSLDDLIETNRRCIATVRQLSQAAFEKLVDASDERLLGDVALVNPGKALPEMEATLSYLDIASLGDGSVSYGSSTPWSEAPGRARRLAEHGDTVWSTVRPNRRAHGLILSPPDDLVVSTGIAVLRGAKVGPATLFAAVDRSEFVDHLVARAEGSAYPAVRSEVFRSIPIPVPAEADRASFESTMWPLWEWAGELGNEVAQLTRTRAELLPLLMSGRVRPGEVAS